VVSLSPSFFVFTLRGRGGGKIRIALPHFSSILPGLMNLKPASRIAIRAVVKTVLALWHA
jgi:hypothetical protein